MPFAAKLTNRTALLIEGVDCRAFLQNLLSNDIARATEKQAIYTALLTPQGKFLHDLFVLETEGGLLLDVDAARADDLIDRLTAYKLRAKVSFSPQNDRFTLWAIWGDEIEQAAAMPSTYADPRLPDMGFRSFVPVGEKPSFVMPVGDEEYDLHRLTLGIADGARDLDVEKSTLIEGNFDLLNGIDWKKGCYIGQELTARMHYRGLAKKRLFPVRLTAPLERGDVLTLRGSDVGEMRSRRGLLGLAALSINETQRVIEEKAAFTCNGTEIYPLWPAWMPQKG